MPKRVARPCAQRGCPHLVRDPGHRYCDEHRRQRQAAYDARRGTAAQRGYDARWRRLRQMFLAAHPLCADPFGVHAARGELMLANEVDHIHPKRDGGDDVWSNFQALCKTCHNRKTIKEIMRGDKNF